jgi:hypothetical protein
VSGSFLAAERLLFACWPVSVRISGSATELATPGALKVGVFHSAQNSKPVLQYFDVWHKFI